MTTYVNLFWDTESSKYVLQPHTIPLINNRMKSFSLIANIRHSIDLAQFFPKIRDRRSFVAGFREKVFF